MRRYCHPSTITHSSDKSCKYDDYCKHTHRENWYSGGWGLQTTAEGAAMIDDEWTHILTLQGFLQAPAPQVRLLILWNVVMESNEVDERNMEAEQKQKRKRRDGWLRKEQRDYPALNWLWISYRDVYATEKHCEAPLRHLCSKQEIGICRVSLLCSKWGKW